MTTRKKTYSYFARADEIAALCGILKKDIPHFVRDKGLPAFQHAPGGPWQSYRPTLRQWAEQYSTNKFLENQRDLKRV